MIYFFCGFKKKILLSEKFVPDNSIIFCVTDGTKKLSRVVISVQDILTEFEWQWIIRKLIQKQLKA